MRDLVIKSLNERGVSLEEIRDIVYEVQKDYHPRLTEEECLESVTDVLGKREVQHALLTGIALDLLAEEKKLAQPLQDIIASDDSLYGVDEVLALAIINVYGSIGFTNFGYIDRVKIGVLDRLNRLEKGQGRVHTFLDDLVAGVAAAAAARIAHRWRDEGRSESKDAIVEE